MEYTNPFQKLCQIETKRLLVMMGIIATVVIVVLSSALPYGNILFSPFLVDSSALSAVPGVVNISEPSNIKETHEQNEKEDQDRIQTNDSALDDQRGQDNSAFELYDDDDTNLNDESLSKNVIELDYNTTFKNERNIDNISTVENVTKEDSGFTLKIKEGSLDTGLTPSPLILAPVSSLTNTRSLRKSNAKSTNFNISSSGEKGSHILSKDEKSGLLQNGSSSMNNSSKKNSPTIKKAVTKKPPKSVTTIAEMNNLFLHSRASSSELSQWSSELDTELISAKLRIENATIIKNDRELYPPLFRNISLFKRSYELMEQILKVYIYKEGERPIFHQGPLRGIYASEGWFMKLMGANKQFVVKNPKKAHLFYLPFSSRLLKLALFVPDSNTNMDMIALLKKYLDTISTTYPYWNRTGGADHFLVACHDRAPSITKNHMNRCVRAICNADVNEGFKIGKDVSLPETFVRFSQNPLRDLGGNRPSKRPILAFFAGNMHGYLRPILLQYWNNKDPDMKIYGPMGGGKKNKNKMNYIQYMKSSKYCICAKGYEVNSPRVVEAIFYDCVPVIISDNFVPPFFEVLNWEAFSVFVAERDIPNLKNILVSIPKEKYLMMQKRVKKVQQHFLWHKNPVKYDIFHMILHSIWYNRVFQVGLNQ